MQLDDIDFVVLGAAKSATTWLRHQLQSDPEIYMPDPELHFFSREYHRGVPWYLDQFRPHPDARLIGEKSNSYLDTEAAAERLHKALPHAKLFVMLRDPVERAYSDYCMLYRRGEVAANIEEHLDPRKAAQHRFLQGSRYDLHLSRILDYYDASAVHVTHYELVAAQPQRVLDGIRRHLSLSARPTTELAERRINDRNTQLLPLSMRRRLAPLKPLVKPVRGSRAFETLRGIFTSSVAYPPLTNDLRNRMAEYFGPMNDSLSRMGYLINQKQI